jgi:hypothetical protein
LLWFKTPVYKFSDLDQHSQPFKSIHKNLYIYIYISSLFLTFFTFFEKIDWFLVIFLLITTKFTIFCHLHIFYGKKNCTNWFLVIFHFFSLFLKKLILLYLIVIDYFFFKTLFYIIINSYLNEIWKKKVFISLKIRFLMNHLIFLIFQHWMPFFD